MAKWASSNNIEFSGRTLKREFSVCLFEMQTGTGKYFYIGMTGDGYYPSARSAIHRLNGHFEKKHDQHKIRFH